MKDLIIVGASGCGREVLQWCKEINAASPTWNIKGFIDDNPDALKDCECDYAVLGSIAEWQPAESEVFAIGIASPAVKEKVVTSLVGRGAVFTSVIHPDAKIGSFNRIGCGVVLYPDCRVTVNASVGDYCIILNGTTVGHDAVIGDYTSICGGCAINGHVEVGKNVFISSHVTTVPGVKIGDDAFVGAGSAVLTRVRRGSRVFGVPAKKFEL